MTKELNCNERHANRVEELEEEHEKEINKLEDRIAGSIEIANGLIKVREKLKKEVDELKEEAELGYNPKKVQLKAREVYGDLVKDNIKLKQQLQKCNKEKDKLHKLIKQLGDTAERQEEEIEKYNKEVDELKDSYNKLLKNRNELYADRQGLALELEKLKNKKMV